MTRFGRRFVCKGTEEMSVGVRKQLREERLWDKVPEGQYHTNNLWVNGFINNPVFGCLKHQSWVLSNSEHLYILLDLWILNTYFSFLQQVKIVV